MWKRMRAGKEGPQKEIPTTTALPSLVHGIKRLLETAEIIQLDLLEQKIGKLRPSEGRT